MPKKGSATLGTMCKDAAYMPCGWKVFVNMTKFCNHRWPPWTSEARSGYEDLQTNGPLGNALQDTELLAINYVTRSSFSQRLGRLMG